MSLLPPPVGPWRQGLLAALLLQTGLTPVAAQTPPPPPSEAMSLWYAQPAAKWTEALPLGNGRLGAMIFGGTDTERIQINEESLWAGCPAEAFAPDYPKHLAEVQRLVLAGQKVEAVAYGLEHLTQRPSSFRSYEPLGDLFLDFGGAGEITSYRRDLSLRDAVNHTRYQAGDATLTREAFISAPADVLVIHLATDKPGSLAFGIRLTRFKDAEVTVHGRDRLHLDGQVVDVPKEDGGPEPNAGGSGPGGDHMRFAGRLLVRADGGEVKPGKDGALQVAHANSATLLFTAATDYHLERLNFDRSIDPAAAADNILDAAAAIPLEELRAAHLEEHREKFDRFALELGPVPTQSARLPTDARLEAVKKGREDPGLTVLLAQYGRYLLLGSSRAPGRLPANLQGIWNERPWAPWEADFHLNINLQMNYWPAPLTGLQEAMDPLHGWFLPLTKRAEMAAKRLYEADGWVCFHATNPFGRVTPSGSNFGSQFKNGSLDPLSGAWLAVQLFDTWRFDPDPARLKPLYPILEGASAFLLDVLVECPDGKLRLVPSTSPENQYIDPKTGKRMRITAGSTYHMSIVRAVFDATARAGEILDTGEAVRARIAEAVKQLPAIQLGPDGRILEWAEPYKEAQPGHRHVSHLIGLHPFDLITRGTPDLFAGARKVIDTRLAKGGAGTGWSRAWTINFFARLGDGEEASTHATELKRRSTLPNLFNSHPPFQIDGNFGFTAGVCEMLAQSHCRDDDGLVILDLLPALPKSWSDGMVRGLRARGGFAIDLEWKDGAMTAATVHAKAGGRVRVRLGEQTRMVEVPAGGSVVLAGQELQLR